VSVRWYRPDGPQRPDDIADDYLALVERRHHEGDITLGATDQILLAIGLALLGLYDDEDDGPDTGEEAPKPPLRAVG